MAERQHQPQRVVRVRMQEMVADNGQIVQVVHPIEPHEVDGVERQHLEVEARHPGASEKRHGRPAHVRNGRTHGDGRVLGHVANLPHGAHDARDVRARVRCHAAAQLHGAHQAIVELPRVRLDLGHQRVGVARHARAIPPEDHALAAKRAIVHAKRDGHLNDRIAFLCHDRCSFFCSRGAAAT